jgi:hypothetical protein
MEEKNKRNIPTGNINLDGNSNLNSNNNNLS